MPEDESFSGQITTEVGSWPGVVVDDGELGELAFKVGHRELGHLHGEHVAHFGFSKAVWQELHTAGRIEGHPVFPGKVLFAAPFEGYGTTVVVHHAGRGLTLYAGLSNCLVNQEDMVTLGQVVGSASDKLYFEIRVENRPENPLNWLR